PRAINSGGSQLLASVLSDAKFKGYATSIYEQSHRLTDIITELMDYAKPVAPQAQNADVAQLIERAVRDAKAQSDPADRKLEITMLGESVPEAAVDPKQISAAMQEV